MSNMDGQMMPKWTQMKTRIRWAIWNSNEDLNTMSNMDGQMMPKWTQMKTRIQWAIWMDKWCQNEHKWRHEYHEQYGWTNDAKMNSNEDLNINEQYGWTNDAKMNSNEDLNPMNNMDGQMMPKWTQMNSNEDLNLMSNMDGQMMPKWTQMKTCIPWAIWMDKWCQNELKWRLESREQYGWTNDAKMNSNEDLKPMSNIDGQMIPKFTQMKARIPWAIWMDKWCQNELKWTQIKTWISWAIWMDKCCQNELKWRLESHEQYGWTNDAKMNTNEDMNTMSNMDGQMMPKWTQMKTWIPWAILIDKWCQNELKWRLESSEQYGWTNDAKINTNEDIEYHEQYGWTNDAKMNSNEDLNLHEQYWLTNDAKMNSNELKWRLESHEQYGWTNDAKMNSNEDLMSMMPKWTQMKTWISWAIWMDKWCQNELKWRLEYHEQYGWTNEAKMNSNEDLNPMNNMDGQMMPKWTQMNSNEDSNIMSNMDGQMVPKWTQMKTRIPWAIWMDKWCQNEHKWRHEYHEQYGWTNDAKMNSNEDLNSMSNMDGQMMPKLTQMKTWIPWAIWMDKRCQNELKWRLESQWAIWMDKWFQNELHWWLEYHEQYGWTNAAKMSSNEDSNPMSNMDGQMMPKMNSNEDLNLMSNMWWTNDAKMNSNEDLNISEQYGWTNEAKMNSNEDLNPMRQYGWTNDAKMNSNEDSNFMSNMDGQMMPKWTQMKTRIRWAIWMDK